MQEGCYEQGFASAESFDVVHAIDDLDQEQMDGEECSFVDCQGTDLCFASYC